MHQNFVSYIKANKEKDVQLPNPYDPAFKRAISCDSNSSLSNIFLKIRFCI